MLKDCDWSSLNYVPVHNQTSLRPSSAVFATSCTLILHGVSCRTSMGKLGRWTCIKHTIFESPLWKLSQISVKKVYHRVWMCIAGMTSHPAKLSFNLRCNTTGVYRSFSQTYMQAEYNRTWLCIYKNKQCERNNYIL